jgi:hypothetical protein
LTDTIVYDNAAAAQVSMPTENLTVTYDFGTKTVKQKTNKTSTVRDPNRVRRVFEWSTLLSRADMDELDGYIRPASAPTYDATYPRIVWTKDGATSENVIGMIIGCVFSMGADAQYWARITFLERFS